MTKFYNQALRTGDNRDLKVILPGQQAQALVMCYEDPDGAMFGASHQPPRDSESYHDSLA